MTRCVSMSTKNHSGDKRGGFVPLDDIAGAVELPNGRALTPAAPQALHHFTRLDQIEESKNWQPILAAAAMLDRGLLDDEGVKRESDQALEHLKKTTAETLATIRTEAEKAIQGAKALADEIEAKARLTAAQISVEEAQKQFKAAANDDQWRCIMLWGWLAGVSVVLLVSAPLLFTQWELPTGAEWPVALYHTLLRVLALSAIAGMAAFGFRMLRAHLHLAEKNRHRVRVANCIESFVQSALEPVQRDLILAKLVDSIVSFGDSGLIHLRGHRNILKRLLIHLAGFNLGVLCRQLIGVGTPRSLQGRRLAALMVLFASWRRLVRVWTVRETEYPALSRSGSAITIDHSSRTPHRKNAFPPRAVRAHLHLAEKNRHRVRVANCIESFVQSALEPVQRDLILAKLVDSIVSFGDSGLIQHDGDYRSSPMSGDVIGRIVAAISSKSSS